MTHFVFTSVSPALPANNPFVRYKRDVESAIRRGPVPWTILQPTAFMEIHAGPVTGWDFRAGRARLIGSGRAVVGYVSVADVAAVAVGSIENPASIGRDLYIPGPEPLTGLEAVAIAEKVTGRTFSVQRMPTGALHVLRTVLRPFHPQLSSLLAMGIGMEQGEPVTTAAVFREYGIRPTTFAEYVQAAIASPLDNPQRI